MALSLPPAHQVTPPVSKENGAENLLNRYVSLCSSLQQKKRPETVLFSAAFSSCQFVADWDDLK
jgi:hypothetical protein